MMSAAIFLSLCRSRSPTLKACLTPVDLENTHRRKFLLTTVLNPTKCSTKCPAYKKPSNPRLNSCSTGKKQRLIAPNPKYTFSDLWFFCWELFRGRFITN
ncbi:unnamed protein product [Lactuca virosa]|uniref:Secreted protein n=1 Tax=Lactuca virosa TaxID=75947 RepID=A0AAU9MXX4_9ASTR|nr:unnamed protein product [Lactuca virosa]